MSRSKHPRRQSKKFSAHKRKNKTWKGDSKWKPKELPAVTTKPRAERRSPRSRYKK